MTHFNAANDPRCARPAELDRLLGDLNRVLDAVTGCDQWRPWLDDWREELADAVTVDGDIVPEAEDEAELASGMREVQLVAYRVCAALKAGFGVGIDLTGDEFPIYPSKV